jgi:hypothetical protein
VHTSDDANRLRLMNKAFNGLRRDEDAWGGFKRETALLDSSSGDGLKDLAVSAKAVDSPARSSS